MAVVRSKDQRLPLWLRIVALAVEEAQPDVLGLTATFEHGELRKRLDPFDLGMAASSITRAVAAGINYGMLHPGSNTRTLHVVPGSLTIEDQA